MNVLITGGTGFIGARLVSLLLSRGDRIRCLVRGNKRLPTGVEAVRGDLLTDHALAEALNGVDVVYHLAGATLVRHPVQYRYINATGTRRLAEACAAMVRPPRVIYLSSLAVVGPSLDGCPKKEDSPERPVSRYGSSKLLGELALRAVSPHVSVTVVRAPGVFGPGDPNLYKLVAAARTGVLVLPRDGAYLLSWIYVDDMAEALVHAAVRGKRLEVSGSQGIYFVGLEQPASLVEFGELAARLQECPRLRIYFAPRPLVRLGGGIIDVWNAITGQSRLMTRDKVREGLAGPWICSVDRARDELGHTCQISLTEGCRRSIVWYRQRGWL